MCGTPNASIAPLSCLVHNPNRPFVSSAGNVFLTKVASTILAVEPDPFGNGYLYLFATLTIIMHATALGMLYWVRGLRRTHTFFCSCGRSCRRHAIVQSPALYRGYVTMRRYCS